MISRGQMMWCLFRKLLINNNYNNNGNNTRERKKMFHSSATNQNQWNVHKKTKFVATTFVRFVCIVSECVPVCERPFSWSNKHSLKWVNRANEIKQSKPSSSKAQQKKKPGQKHWDRISSYSIICSILFDCCIVLAAVFFDKAIKNQSKRNTTTEIKKCIEWKIQIV